MDDLGSRVARWLLRVRWWLLGVGIVLALLAWGPAQRLPWDQRLETMFAPDDPRRVALSEWKARFGAGEVVLAVYRDQQLFAPDGQGLKRLERVAGRLRSVPQVRQVVCLADLDPMLRQLAGARRLARWLGGPAAPPGLAAEGGGILSEDPLAQRLRACFAGATHSADGNVAALVVVLENPGGNQPATDASKAAMTSSAAPRPAAPTRRAVVEALAAAMRELPDGLAPGYVVGEPVLLAEGFALVESDGRRLAVGTTILVGLVILACFRSLRWLIAPLAIVHWSILATRAVLAVSQFHLSMVSAMLAALITVIGVATVMHWIVRLRELGQMGLSPHDALEKSIPLLAGPITLALVTDAIGFGALVTSRVAPVRDFGGMMALGSLMVWPAVWLLLPALALAPGLFHPRVAVASPPDRLADWLSRSAGWIERHRGSLAGGLLLGAAVAAAGIGRLEVQSDFLSNFRQGSDIAQAYDFVERHLGGAGVWDVVVVAPDVLDEAYLARVRRLEERLRQITIPGGGAEQAGLTQVLSLVDLIDAAAVEPALAALAPELRAAALASTLPELARSLRAKGPPGEGRLRIMLRARERQPAEQKQRLVATVEQIAREEFPEGAFVTGYYVLLADLVSSLLRDQWLSFALASGGIFLTMLAAFRSVRLALLGLLPNALPILVVLGSMGWLAGLGLADVKLNMGAAMIAAVSMGLSVDGSLHYLYVYQRAQLRGQRHALALAAAQQSVGQAMILSTLALVLGFLVLLTSPFVPTIYFGALMALAMVGGLVGNLVLLPVLLVWTAPAER